MSAGQALLSGQRCSLHQQAGSGPAVSEDSAQSQLQVAPGGVCIPLPGAADGLPGEPAAQTFDAADGSGVSRRPGRAATSRASPESHRLELMGAVSRALMSGSLPAVKALSRELLRLPSIIVWGS